LYDYFIALFKSLFHSGKNHLKDKAAYQLCIHPKRYKTIEVEKKQLDENGFSTEKHNCLALVFPENIYRNKKK